MKQINAFVNFFIFLIFALHLVQCDILRSGTFKESRYERTGNKFELYTRSMNTRSRNYRLLDRRKLSVQRTLLPEKGHFYPNHKNDSYSPDNSLNAAVKTVLNAVWQLRGALAKIEVMSRNENRRILSGSDVNRMTSASKYKKPSYVKLPSLSTILEQGGNEDNIRTIENKVKRGFVKHLSTLRNDMSHRLRSRVERIDKEKIKSGRTTDPQRTTFLRKSNLSRGRRINRISNFMHWNSLDSIIRSLPKKNMASTRSNVEILDKRNFFRISDNRFGRQEIANFRKTSLSNLRSGRSSETSWETVEIPSRIVKGEAERRREGASLRSRRELKMPNRETRRVTSESSSYRKKDIFRVKNDEEILDHRETVGTPRRIVKGEAERRREGASLRSRRELKIPNRETRRVTSESSSYRKKDIFRVKNDEEILDRRETVETPRRIVRGEAVRRREVASLRSRRELKIPNRETQRATSESSSYRKKYIFRVNNDEEILLRSRNGRGFRGRIMMKSTGKMTHSRREFRYFRFRQFDFKNMKLKLKETISKQTFPKETRRITYLRRNMRKIESPALNIDNGSSRNRMPFSNIKQNRYERMPLQKVLQNCPSRRINSQKIKRLFIELVRSSTHNRRDGDAIKMIRKTGKLMSIKNNIRDISHSDNCQVRLENRNFVRFSASKEEQMLRQSKSSLPNTFLFSVTDISGFSRRVNIIKSKRYSVFGRFTRNSLFTTLKENGRINRKQITSTRSEDASGRKLIARHAVWEEKIYQTRNDMHISPIRKNQIERRFDRRTYNDARKYINLMKDTLVTQDLPNVRRLSYSERSRRHSNSRNQYFASPNVISLLPVRYLSEKNRFQVSYQRQTPPAFQKVSDLSLKRTSFPKDAFNKERRMRSNGGTSWTTIHSVAELTVPSNVYSNQDRRNDIHFHRSPSILSYRERALKSANRHIMFSTIGRVVDERRSNRIHRILQDFDKEQTEISSKVSILKVSNIFRERRLQRFASPYRDLERTIKAKPTRMNSLYSSKSLMSLDDNLKKEILSTSDAKHSPSSANSWNIPKYFHDRSSAGYSIIFDMLLGWMILYAVTQDSNKGYFSRVKNYVNGLYLSGVSQITTY